MRFCGFLVIQLAAISLLSPSLLVAQDDAGIKFFETRIRPLLVEHCYKCHSEKSKNIRGGLLLDTREGIRAGGETGPAVVPGRPSESLLINAIQFDDFEMPPKGKLSKQAIRDLIRWVKIGAPDPRDGKPRKLKSEIDIEKGRSFWSFRPIKRPKTPNTVLKNWPRDDIDRFILQQLEAKGLAPAKDADRTTLLRRLYFDLIGLPPTPKQIDKYLKDESPKALERVVDELLASPHFGERWGRHYLDYVRFAESSGGGRTRIFHNAWRYRDYVIKSLNQDKPYDQFIAEQLAGDLMPSSSIEEQGDRLVALGFLSIGPINYELQDKQLLRMEVVDEQLDTLGRAFLGMTIGCARCHDHKFDPIPTTDYYAMAGILRSTQTLTDANVSNPVQRSLPADEKAIAARKEYEKQAAPLQKAIAAVKASVTKLTPKRGKAVAAVGSVPGIVVDERDKTTKLIGTWTASTSIPAYYHDSYHHTAPGVGKAEYQVKLPADGLYEVRLAYSPSGNRSSNAQVTVWHADGERQFIVNQRRTPPINGLWKPLGKFQFRKDTPARIVISSEGADGVTIADAVQLLSEEALKTPQKKSDVNVAKTNGETAKLESAKKRLAALEAQLKKLSANAPAKPPTVMAVRDHTAEEIGDGFVCIRGNVHNPGPVVPRGFLSVATYQTAPKFEAGKSGRLQLARWIGSSDNPLTARVMANRVWHHLFGSGIVRTVDHFGSMGEMPSHPELLNHLAAEFIENGWSVKQLIRQIVLSRTYGMSGSQTTKAKKLDPENRLLSYRGRRRLDAECIRDAMLQISGQLDLTPGGSSIPASAKSEFGYQFKTLRRSVYVPVFRNTLHEMFEVFDFADPNLVVGRRNRSTLPTQALLLMNSELVMKQATSAAKRLLSAQQLADDERIELAYRWTLARTPNFNERGITQRYLEQHTDTDAEAVWSDVFQSLFGCIDFRFVE